MKRILLIYFFLMMYCINNTATGIPWNAGGWNTGARFLSNGSAKIIYDKDNDAWMTNKPIVSTTASSLIQGNGKDNLDIDANGQSITLGNAVSDYLSVNDDGIVSFYGNSHMLVNDDVPLILGNDNDAQIIYDTSGSNDFLYLSLKTNSPLHSGYLILCDNDTINEPNAIPTSYTSNPTLRFISQNIEVSPSYYAELFASTYGTFNIKGGYLNNINFRNIGNDIIALNLITIAGENLSLKADTKNGQSVIALNSTVNKTVIITDYANKSKDHNLSASTHPMLCVQSELDPEIDSDSNGVNDYTKRLSLYHNSTNAVIDVGEGDIELKYADTLRFVMDNDGMLVYIKNGNTSKTDNGNWRCGIDPDNDDRFVFQKYGQGVWNDVMDLP
ncbi:hypothetical protein J7L67_10080 [bacterium]|nr:hypothetical protein [bacterium]